MIHLLVLKERVREIYQKYQWLILPFIRFFYAFFVFYLINQQIGYNEKLQKWPVVLLLSLACAFLPTSVMVFFAAALVTAHIFAASQILTLVFFLVLLILYLLFVRFTPRYGWVVLAVPILYHLQIPYLIPVLLGLIATPVTVITAGCGVIMHYLFLLIKDSALMATGEIGLEDSLQLYTYVLKNLVENKQMLLTIGVFFCVILITYFVKRLRIEHAHELAIIAGVLVNILLFLLGDLMLRVSERILPMLLGSLITGLIAEIIQFFRFSLDYSAIEQVQFEDDDYYYYVKAVPKKRVTTPEINVKRITPKKGRQVDTELKEWEGEPEYESAQDYEQDRPAGKTEKEE